MNIVYGGSFNPPTKAHRYILELLKEKYNPENIIVVPTPNSYTWKIVASFEDRINMCKLAFSDYIISSVENRTPYQGSLETLNILSNDYSDIYFTMGADNLISIKKWINYESLLNNYHFIIFKRDNIDIEKFIIDELYEYKDKFEIVDFDSKISSTEYRLSKNEDLIDSKVVEYIKDNHLYEEDCNV